MKRFPFVPWLKEVSLTTPSGAGHTITFELDQLVVGTPRLDHTQQRHLKQLCWSISGFLLILALVMSAWLFPHGSTAAATSSSGAKGGSRSSLITSEPICGHPDEVFRQLGFASSDVPSQQFLLKLPQPISTSRHLPEDLTYDPTTDVLCTTGWKSIYAHYVEPHTSRMGAFDPPAESSFGLDWVQGILTGLVTSTAHGLGDFLNLIIGWFNSLLFFVITPHEDTDGLAVIQALHGWSVTVVDSALCLILVVGGYNYMFQPDGLFREVAPRLLFSVIAATFSLTFISQFIDLNNALCQGIQTTLATAGIGDLQLPLGALNWVTAPVYEIIVYLIDLLMCVLLGIEMLVRIATLDLLIVLAPIGMFCFALPQTLAWGRLWVQSFVATLIVQFLQEVCIGMGSALISSFGHASLSVIALLVGIAALYVAFKIPNMLLSSVVRSTMGEVHRDIGGAIRTVAETAALIAA